jgi:hypothetical protein
MTAKGVEDIAKLLLGKIGSSVSFIYGIEPLPHQPLHPEYLDYEESAHNPSATGFDSMALDPLHLLGIDLIKFLTLFLGIVRHSCCNIWRS